MNPVEHRQKNSEAAGKWLRGMGFTPSALGVRACVLLALWEQGFHHIYYPKDVTWNDEACVIAKVRNGLATADHNDLSRLVFLAHDECLRVEIQPPESPDSEADPKPHDEEHPYTLRLLISARSRSGEFYETHPTLENAVAMFRKKFSADLAFAESEVAA